MRRRALALVLGPLLLSACASLPPPCVPPEPSIRRRVFVIAHRGAHADVPGNSLPAIRRAIALGVDYVEADVRRTRDGALVLLHDKEVDRMTDGEGLVESLTLKQIRALTLGGVPGLRIPTFAEALAACRGKIGIYVDAKNAPPAQVVELLKAHDMLEHAVIYAGETALREYKRLAAKLRILAPHPRDPKQLRRLIAELQPELLDGNTRKWTRAQVHLAHEAGVEVWVDDLREYDCEEGHRVALSLGVDAIQTDHPKELLEQLQQAGRR